MSRALVVMWVLAIEAAILFATRSAEGEAEPALYEAGEVVSSYPGGSCKPCVRGCLVGSDHLPAMGDPKEGHAWISRMQLCIMAECRP